MVSAVGVASLMGPECTFLSAQVPSHASQQDVIRVSLSGSVYGTVLVAMGGAEMYKTEFSLKKARMLRGGENRVKHLICVTNSTRHS